MTRYLVADDLTGACDAALAYAKRGARAVAWLDATPAPADERELLGADLIAIDLDSRAESPERAYARMSALLDRLRPQRPSDVILKMDSTLRGNVDAELRALLTYFPDAIAIVAPSLPAQGRTIRNGVLFLHGMPMSASDVAARFASPSVRIDLKTLRAGTAIAAEALASTRDRGARVAIVDSETDDDLRALVACANGREDVLWVGSAGLIECLASAELGDAAEAIVTEGATGAGRVLFLVGSQSTVTRQQIASFATVATTETIDPNVLLRGGAEVDAAIARVAAGLDQRNVALIAIGSNPHIDHLRLRAAFIAAAAPLVRGRDALTVVLSGGDIARAFCDAFGIRGLSIRDELAPGIPRSRALGTPFDLVTKAGGFGSPQTYRELWRILHERASV